jgi:hypothetical protein
MGPDNGGLCNAVAHRILRRDHLKSIGSTAELTVGLPTKASSGKPID